MGDLAENLDGLDAEKVELRAALRRTQRALERSKAKTADLLDAVYEGAKDAALAMGPSKAPPRLARDRRKSSGEVALLHTTDWQVGKVTETYNSEIARRRLTEELPAKVERLTALQREAHPVRSAHYMVGGDNVEGVGIFPGQAFSVDSTTFEQLFCAVGILESQLLHGLTVFETIDVWEEDGNHGRIGKKGEYPSDDNFDRIMFRIAMERMRHESRLTFHPRESGKFYNHLSIGNYKALLFHGDEIKSFGGNTPAFGILRKTTKWLAGSPRTCPWFLDAYHGHFHTAMTLVLPHGGRIFGTGSPETDNGYAAEFMAEGGDPNQRLHFIDPEAGRVTAEYLIRFR